MDYTGKRLARAHSIEYINVVIQMGMLQVPGKKVATSRLATEAPNIVGSIDLRETFCSLHKEET